MGTSCILYIKRFTIADITKIGSTYLGWKPPELAGLGDDDFDAETVKSAL
jgi:hypothetical protein